MKKLDVFARSPYGRKRDGNRGNNKGKQGGNRRPKNKAPRSPRQSPKAPRQSPRAPQQPPNIPQQSPKGSGGSREKSEPTRDNQQARDSEAQRQEELKRQAQREGQERQHRLQVKRAENIKTGLIIGGVVLGVLLLIAILSIIVSIVKKRRGAKSVVYPEHPVVEPPHPVFVQDVSYVGGSQPPPVYQEVSPVMQSVSHEKSYGHKN